MKKYGLVAACLAFGAFPLPGVRALQPQQQSPAAVSALEASLPKLIKEARIPGMQVALIQNGKIVWHGNFGVTSAASGTPVTDDTLFEAASLTKPFFAYYVMKLVDQGVLSLDKPLVSQAPAGVVEAFLGHPLGEQGFHREWLAKIDARQILSHSAGTPHGQSGRPFPLLFEPGTQWKYSADGYFLLQKVIEALEGDKLENLMQKEVLDPLGMTRSRLVWREDYEKTMASGHDFFGAPQAFRKRTESHAGASLYTTAEDYAKFVCAVVNGVGLEPATLTGMITSRIDMDETRGLGWSLGFGTQADVRGAGLWQWGDYGIFRNYVLAFPGDGSGVVYLTNSFFGLGIASEVTSRAVGAPALGALSLKYLPYDSPIYRLGWQLAEKGAAIAPALPELAKAMPEAFSKDAVEGLREVFDGSDKQAGLLALLEFNAREHRRSGEAQFALAKALMEAGELTRVEALLKKAKGAAEDKVEAERIEWNLSYVRALAKPLQLEEDDLRKIAGVYGVRHLEVREGRLFYFREGGSTPDFRPLVAMSKDTFLLEGLSFFRLRIVFDEQGLPIRAVGLYEDGRQDESLRNP